ncbi:MAG: hypothetical protein VXU46_01900, partial [Planctomycetota bacterium]|nr:hypothetical protein [Planctomycetota bacterium]
MAYSLEVSGVYLGPSLAAGCVRQVKTSRGIITGSREPDPSCVSAFYWCSIADHKEGHAFQI